MGADWRAIESQPWGRARSALGCASLNGLVYAVGGFSAPNYLDAVECYDPDADSWWPVAPLCAPRRGLGCAALEAYGLLLAAGGVAYAVGGFDGAAAGRWAEAYEPRMDAWREAPQLAEAPRLGLALAAVLSA